MLKICPFCHTENDAEYNFCYKCAEDLTNVNPLTDDDRLCPFCKTVNKSEYSYCYNCAMPLDESAPVTEVKESTAPIVQEAPIVEEAPVVQEAAPEINYRDFVKPDKKFSLPSKNVIVAAVAVIIVAALVVTGVKVVPKIAKSDKDIQTAATEEQSVEETPTSAQKEETEQETDATTTEATTSSSSGKMTSEEFDDLVLDTVWCYDDYYTEDGVEYHCTRIMVFDEDWCTVFYDDENTGKELINYSYYYNEETGKVEMSEEYSFQDPFEADITIDAETRNDMHARTRDAVLDPKSTATTLYFTSNNDEVSEYIDGDYEFIQFGIDEDMYTEYSA